MQHVTYDPDIVSHQQIKLIMQEEGKRVRQREEEERKDAVFCFVKSAHTVDLHGMEGCIPQQFWKRSLS